MALLSSVPKLQFTPAGLVVPAETDVLAGVQADINAAFGGGLNPALETPQGQLASSQAAVIGDKNNEIALVVNQVDPQYAAGRFQDAIGRIYFLNRKPATSTTVQATLIGLAGTTVPAGTLAQDTSGNTYALSGDATIGVTGQVDAELYNVKPGPIPCPAGTLTQVYQAVPGWDAIANTAAGVPGTDVEGRAEFEFRRYNSVAINGHGSPQAIYGEVFDVDGVLDVLVLDNPTGDHVEVGPTHYGLLPHSVYVAVVGGVDQDIAEAIWRKKDLGCQYNGNTEVKVIDASGYSYPQPSYMVKFQRPTSTPVKFAVRLVSDPSLPSDVVGRVKRAIVARFNGQDGTARERIGGSIFASRYYGAIVAAVPNLALIDVLTGTGTPDKVQVDIGIDQAPSLTESDITVTLV